jgi:hypothetical protein
MRYREPPGLIQRFGYPVDFGAAVVATGTRTFRVVGAVSPEIDPNGLLPRDTRHIFLYQLNLAWKPGDAPSTLFTVPPRIYTVGSLVSGRRGFTIVEAISATSGDPVHSVGGMGSVGYIDADGVLRSRGVTDGFKNLRPNGRIYLEQRPLANPAAPFARPDPILDPDESVYTIRPGLYRIVELRGQGVRIDLEGQRSKPGTPVVFRAGFLPPAVKIETTVDRGNGKVVRCAPLVIRMPQE